VAMRELSSFTVAVGGLGARTRGFMVSGLYSVSQGFKLILNEAARRITAAIVEVNILLFSILVPAQKRTKSN
jgi:hypothetical protein